MKQSAENIVGYAVNTKGVQACVEELAECIASSAGDAQRCRWLACLNPHSYAESLRDPDFSRALHAADWLIPDGVGVVLASRLNRGQIQERVTGSDIFRGVHEALNKTGGYSVFFLGSTEDTLAKIRARMAIDFPNIRIAGTYSPPFKPKYSAEEMRQMVNAINTAAPDVLWVGMTAPKQEKWIEAAKGEMNVRFAAAVGAVFDFYVGNVKRSHPVFQKIGLEWLPRLLQQPKRLWKRTFVSAPIFLWHVLLQIFRRRLMVS